MKEIFSVFIYELNLNLFMAVGSGRDKVGYRMREGVGQCLNGRYHPLFALCDQEKVSVKMVGRWCRTENLTRDTLSESMRYLGSIQEYSGFNVCCKFKSVVKPHGQLLRFVC